MKKVIIVASVIAAAVNLGACAMEAADLLKGAPAAEQDWQSKVLNRDGGETTADGGKK